MTARNKLALLALILTATSFSARADDYSVDGSHAAAVFRVSHVGLSWTHGRFKELSGTFAFHADSPEATRFELSARVDSIDTDNTKRDEHLKSPDFFNARQFPVITFKSTSAKAVKGGYEVAGDLTLHGVTKPITLVFLGGKTAEFPKGVQRTGFTADFVIKRSEFGMDQALQAIGDEVFIQLSFEGIKK